MKLEVMRPYKGRCQWNSPCLCTLFHCLPLVKCNVINVMVKCVHVIQPFESRLYTSPAYWNKSWEQTQSLHVKPQLQGSAAAEPEQRLWWFLDSSREKQRHRRGQQEPNEITVLYTWLLTVQKWLFRLSLWFSLVCFIKWYNCMVW